MNSSISTPSLVQIGLPRFYRNSPILLIPLFHEIGHFIDKHYQITHRVTIHLNLSKTLDVVFPFLKNINHMPFLAAMEAREMASNHAAEFFADLLAAIYVGPAISEFLVSMAGEQPASFSHPSSSSRSEIVDCMLTKKQHPFVEAVQEVLAKLKLPMLEARWSPIDLIKWLNVMRPPHVENDGQLFGLFCEGWQVGNNLEGSGTSEPWTSMSNGKQFSAINDLIQKAIRNYSIRTQWRDGNSRG